MKQLIIDTLNKKEMTVEELSKELNLNDSKSFVELNKTVNKLIDEGILFDIEDKVYSSEIYSVGTIKRDRDFYYILDNGPREIKNEIGLFEGDEVIYKEEGPYVRVIKVIKHKFLYVLGTIQFRKGRPYFYSDDFKFQDYEVVNFKEFGSRLKKNDRVRAYISDYSKQLLKIDTIIGQAGSEEVLIKTILLMNDAPGKFSKDTESEVNKLSDEVVIEDRKDLRDLDFITIDGEDAKDFDDAIYVNRRDDGYDLYVSIADVSHYVTEGSALDKDARKRGTSIYYPGHVIPMLPEKLCNDLCSLKEGVNRYTLTCQMQVDYEGNVVTYDIYPSLICSRHRMTYTKVNKILEHDKELVEEYSDINQMIYAAYELSRIVDHNRKEKGGIEFSENEPLIIEENGKVVDIQMRQSGKAEVMIEDFMILANETVAQHMYYLGYPLVYRNHDYPKPDKLSKFIEVMRELDYTFKSTQDIKSSLLQKCLNSFEGREEYSLVSDLLLRSMAKALYETTCIGHYGLGLEHYCHFTSPIRRYPDLIVHRMLRKYIFNNNTSDIDKDNELNEDIVKICNQTEKRAVQIERNVTDLKKCEYMAQRIGEVYEVMISSVVSYGFYVELPNTVEGLVHIKSLDGFYEYDGNRLYNGINTYEIGQKVKVRLVNVDLDRRNIDFEIYRKYR